MVFVVQHRGTNVAVSLVSTQRLILYQRVFWVWMVMVEIERNVQNCCTRFDSLTCLHDTLHVMQGNTHACGVRAFMPVFFRGARSRYNGNPRLSRTRRWYLQECQLAVVFPQTRRLHMAEQRHSPSEQPKVRTAVRAGMVLMPPHAIFPWRFGGERRSTKTSAYCAPRLVFCLRPNASAVRWPRLM